MNGSWEVFVKRAIEGEPDDPFVTLLRRRVASGYRIVRVHFEPKPKGAEYRIVLVYLRELSELRVPHSPSFTRWSLGTGTRMASVEEEEQRFGLLVTERFQAIADELGADYADVIFVERARALAPPRTTARLAHVRKPPTAPGREQMRAARRMDAFFAALAAELSGALHYAANEVAQILDGALERFVSARFHVEAETSERRAAG